MTQQQLTTTFDYSQLDDGVRKFVLARKQDMIKRNGLAIIADGHDLLAIKQALKGKFYEWLKTEYWFSPRTAEKRMQVAEMVNAKSELNSDFENKTISELYELAAAYHRPQAEAPEDTFNRAERGMGKGATDLVYQVLGKIDLDPASDAEANETVQATAIFTEEDDGKQQEWHGRVFLNPLWSDILAFLYTLFQEYEAGNTTEAIVLLPDKADTSWYKLIYPYTHCRFYERIDFIKHGDTAPTNGNPYGSVVLYLGEHPERFISVFSPYGAVYPGVQQQSVTKQEVQGILGEYGLPMQDEDDTPLPDGADIDVPALYTKCQQQAEAIATLEGQLQEALRQGASIDASAPPRHYGGGGGHHKPPISEKDGVTRTMVNYDHWETTKIRLDPGWNFEDFGMGTIDMQGGTYEIVVSDKKKQCVVPVKPHDIPSVRQELQKLDQGLEKRYAAWKATQK